MKKTIVILKDIGSMIGVGILLIFLVALLSNLPIFQLIFAIFYATIGALFSAFNG